MAQEAHASRARLKVINVAQYPPHYGVPELSAARPDFVTLGHPTTILTAGDEREDEYSLRHATDQHRNFVVICRQFYACRHPTQEGDLVAIGPNVDRTTQSKVVKRRGSTLPGTSAFFIMKDYLP